MRDVDGVLHQFKIINEFLDEHYPDLTVLQCQQLRSKAVEVWEILDRRRKKVKHDSTC